MLICSTQYAGSPGLMSLIGTGNSGAKLSKSLNGKSHDRNSTFQAESQFHNLAFVCLLTTALLWNAGVPALLFCTHKAMQLCQQSRAGSHGHATQTANSLETSTFPISPFCKVG